MNACLWPASDLPLTFSRYDDTVTLGEIIEGITVAIKNGFMLYSYWRR